MLGRAGASDSTTDACWRALSACGRGGLQQLVGVEVTTRYGLVAEKLGSGLQNRIQQCDSAPDLHAALSNVRSYKGRTKEKDYMQQIGWLIAQVIVSILLVVTVLLQQKGTGLGGAFGGEGNVYRTRRGLERTLFTTTIILGVLYVLIAGFSVFFNR